jgi:hypothetical protein
MHIDGNLRPGMSPAGARRHAMLMLGGVTATTQQYREHRGVDAALLKPLPYRDPTRLMGMFWRSRKRPILRRLV